MLQGLYEDGVKVGCSDGLYIPKDFLWYVHGADGSAQIPRGWQVDWALHAGPGIYQRGKTKELLSSAYHFQGEQGEFVAYGLLHAAAAGTGVLTHEMKEALSDPGRQAFA